MTIKEDNEGNAEAYGAMMARSRSIGSGSPPGVVWPALESHPANCLSSTRSAVGASREIERERRVRLCSPGMGLLYYSGVPSLRQAALYSPSAEYHEPAWVASRTFIVKEWCFCLEDNEALWNSWRVPGVWNERIERKKKKKEKRKRGNGSNPCC